MAKRIVIDAGDSTDIPVQLVGVEYLVNPPKSTVAIALAQRIKDAGEDPGQLLEELHGWVRAAFGKKQGKAIIERLSDPEDQLDIPHIVQLMQKITEVATGDPTT